MTKDPFGTTLTGTIIPSQSGPGSNVNESVLHTPHISRTESSASDAVLCHTQEPPVFFGGGFSVGRSFPSSGDTISVF